MLVSTDACGCVCVCVCVCESVLLSACGLVDQAWAALRGMDMCVARSEGFPLQKQV